MSNKSVEFEKGQVIARIAEGIAHHMGTPLASILLRVQMLKEDMTGVPRYKDYEEKLESIERQIFYSQKVIQSLLRFVIETQNNKFLERISVILENSLEVLMPFIKKQQITLELNLDQDVKLLADSNLLRLVFRDIIINALEAMPEKGTLSISTTKDEFKLIKIIISDNGIGISKDVLPLIFEPFFTTKTAGRATGLGLTVARRIINDHGGEITIETELGIGTRVMINLPIFRGEA